MNSAPCVSHLTWSSLSQFFTYQRILLLFSLTLVIGDPCPYNKLNHVIKKTCGEETTYFVSKGEPLDLFCTLRADYNWSHLTSEDLKFERAQSEKVDKQYQPKVNKTTIRMRLKNEEAGGKKYFCYLNISNNSRESNEIDDSSENQVLSKKNDSGGTETVCWNIIEVVEVPMKVENISCTVYNLQELNCTWDIPEQRSKHRYTTQYETVSSNHLGIEALACPNDDDVHNNTCKWTLSTKPPYRKDFEKLKITVTGVNIVNKTSRTSVVYDQFAILQVKGPENLKLLGKTSTSINLEWSIGKVPYFFKPWAYRIRYKTTESDWNVLDCKNVTTNGDKVSYNVINLMSDTLYDFQVFMKPHSANDSYWSHSYAGKVFRTKKLCM